MEIKSNDRSTFDVVYETYADKVHYIALHNSGDDRFADDITQMVFITLNKHLDNINLDKVDAWLTTTAKCMTSNQLKYVKSQKRNEDMTVPLTEYVEEVKMNNLYEESMEDAYIRKLERQERQKLLEKIFTALYEKNQRWYEAFTMIYLLECSHEDVAKAMKMPVKSLNVILFRTRRWIQKKFRKEFDHLEKE